jgi:Kdo2-lipid IVA lauroyltransferase/acyltransferase
VSELGAFLAVAAARAVAHLPLRLLHAIGTAAGWITYLARGKYRRRLRRNLRQANLAQGAAEFARLKRQVIAEQGKAALELPMMWLRSSVDLLRLVRSVEGMEHVEAARAAGRGIIFITPHLGNFEMAGRYVSSIMPVVFLYRPPRARALEPLMNAGRGRDDASMAPANTRGVRMMFKALKRGGAVGILPDQAPAAGEGVWADFFGRPAYTMTLVARLQQSTGAYVIPFYAERLSYAHGYKMVFSSPLYLQGYTPVEGALCLNLGVESMVRRCARQYLWSYNRYKIPRDGAPPPHASAAPNAEEQEELARLWVAGEQASAQSAYAVEGVPARPQ